MENKILLDLNLFKVILDQEAKKLVGKVCKRFEVLENKDEIKKDSKELIYEFSRDLYELFATGKMIFEFQNKNEKL